MPKCSMSRKIWLHSSTTLPTVQAIVAHMECLAFSRLRDRNPIKPAIHQQFRFLKCMGNQFKFALFKGPSSPKSICSHVSREELPSRAVRCGRVSGPELVSELNESGIRFFHLVQCFLSICLTIGFLHLKQFSGSFGPFR